MNLIKYKLAHQIQQKRNSPHKQNLDLVDLQEQESFQSNAITKQKNKEDHHNFNKDRKNNNGAIIMLILGFLLFLFTFDAYISQQSQLQISIKFQKSNMDQFQQKKIKNTNSQAIKDDTIKIKVTKQTINQISNETNISKAEKKQNIQNISKIDNKQQQKVLRKQNQIIIQQKQIQKTIIKSEIQNQITVYDLLQKISKDPLKKAKYIPTTRISEKQRLQFAKYIELKNSGHQDLAKEEYYYYQAKYKISQYKQLPFCVVIPSYNNVKNERYKKNIDSIIRQNYSNFHVVFMDDKSTDGTGQKMQKYVNSLDQNIKNKIKIIINSEHQTALPSLVYAARNQCKPQQIYTIVDGDDQLIGRQLLKALNAYYQQTGAWFIYGNWMSPRTGFSSAYPTSVIQAGSFRSYRQFLCSHVRTFYTKLFLLINDQDLKNDKGQYYQVTYDMTFLYPIMQMSRFKIEYFPQLTYFYNMNTGMNDARLRFKQQLDADKSIRKKKPYQQLKQLFSNKKIG